MSERDRAPSRPPRVYVPDLAEQLAGSEETGEKKEKEILLLKEEKAHVRSRRLRDGDVVVALDGKGLRFRAMLTRRASAIALAVLPSKKIPGALRSSPDEDSLPGEPRNRVVVALACAEPARVEWAIEKGTECGAAGFVLLACERSQRAHVAALSSPARLERLRRIAVEATKQCDRTIVPFVDGPKSTEEFLRGLRDETLLVADPVVLVDREGGRPMPSRRTRVLSERSEFTREGEGASASARTVIPTVVAIGPEGGFTPAELLLFEEKAALRTSLGPRILRLETAVVAALVRLVEPR